MDWSRLPAPENVTELASVVGEAEFVLDFGGEVQAVFRLRVCEDLLAEEAAERFFARAEAVDEAGLCGRGIADTPEAAAALCLRDAGVSLRRARGR